MEPRDAIGSLKHLQCVVFLWYSHANGRAYFIERPHALYKWLNPNILEDWRIAVVLAPTFAKMKNSTMQLHADELLKLKDILTRTSLSFEEVQLSSGENSTVYVDGKLATCRAEAMPLIGRIFLSKIKDEGWTPEAVGGLTVGADPIAMAIARESLATPPTINAFIVRKAVKEHGKHRLVEGIEKPEGCNVVIIDDVCTKGGSTAQAIETARKVGMNVLGAACLVDRQQGATQLLVREFNLRLASIFTLADLLAHKELLDAEPVRAAG